WLAVDEDDKKISREIYASEHKNTTYRIKTITADVFGSGTDSKVYIIIFGENNDT
ncbi:unnamed protein product, partial [Rotaria sp. Silwood1]